jgi:UDP-3-O-acyl N-acetylglucosamine deacetylase
MSGATTRRTIARECVVGGPALFSAEGTLVTLKPARVGAGITFRRVDGLNGPVIAAVVANVPAMGADRTRNTIVAAAGSTVMTVEHVLSAAAGLGVTDLEIEMNGGEIPIMDGSAAMFVGVMRAVGVVEIGKGPAAIELKREIVIEDGKARVTATPRQEPGFSLRYELDYGGPAGSSLGVASAAWKGDADDYAENIAPARTFCTKREAEQFKSKGLFPHLSAREMLVLDDATGVPMENSLRYKDEPARHKLLDLIGDLALLGRQLQADVVAVRSGHHHTHALVREILRG